MKGTHIQYQVDVSDLNLMIGGALNGVLTTVQFTSCAPARSLGSVIQSVQ